MLAHRDKWGLLTFVTWANKGDDRYEGGDTAHREGMHAAGVAWTGTNEEINHERTRFKAVIRMLQHPTKKGHWRRHPDESKWYGWWENMSRDQATMIVVALSALEMHKELDQFYWHLLLRGSFMTNSRHNGAYPEDHASYSPTFPKKWADKKPFWKRDLCGPDFWGVWIRHKIKHTKWGRRFLKPALKFLDWFGHLDTIAKLHYGQESPKNVDDSNFIAIKIHAQRTWETPKGREQRLRYFHGRAFAADPNMKEYEVTNGPASAMRLYFDGNVWGIGASPPLDRLWKPLVDAMGD